MVTYTKSKTWFIGGWKATLTLLLVMLVGAALAQDPGHAHRWNAGDGWRYNTSTGKWDIITANAQNLPLGIVRCASSAETESGLQAFTGAYNSLSFKVGGTTNALPETGGLPCFSQQTETRGVQVSLPTQNEEIIWFNFDIRPLAGTYQFQIVTNQNVGWALYYVDPAFAGPAGSTTSGTYPPGYNDANNLNNISGTLGTNFTNLRYADCGVSGNGWSTITVPSFQKPTNYYLAMWQLDPAVTSFPNSTNLVYKSRYGCGGVTCTLEKDGADSKNCVVGTNNYTVCATYFGSAGRWAIIDSAAVKASSYTVTTYDQFGAQVSTATSNNLTTTPLYLELGTISWASPQNDIKAVICATYPLGANYYIALQPAGTPSGAPSNYIACTSSGRFMGVGLPSNTITPNPGAATACINTAITPIVHNTTGATGIGSATGLPAGVTASFLNNTLTISGTPTVAGTFNYTVPLTGGCGTASASGTITVTAANDAGLPVTRTLCIGTALSPVITHNTTGATSIGSATGLPTGVTATFANNTITISGTPTVSGTFNYSVPLVGGCGNISATGQITVTPNNTVTGPGSAAPCVNTAMTPITHTTTGATGIGAASGLPAGVTAVWANNTITISGTPTAVGTFNYTIPLTGGCGNINATGSITVTATNTVSGPGARTVCVGTAMTAITHNTTGATGIGSATGLPAGVTAAWANNVITISGTPTATGTFNYTIPLTGGCGNVSATGTITVNPNNTVTGPGSRTVCINTAMTAITHTTTGATGIGSATGLPTGVTAVWANNVITISGTPTVSGIFNYTIPLTGGCGNINATGTITVTANNTVTGPGSGSVCVNQALTPITHTTTGATGIGAASGLPTGVTAAWANNVITISGTPTATGTFNYTIPLTGGCGNVNATGTITVTATNTVTGPGARTVCVGTAMTAITHTTTGATGIGAATGLPAGVTAVWANNTITISGTPTATGTFNYTIPLTGGCGNVNATGTITVNANNTVTGPGSRTVCVGTAMTAITHTTTGATGIGSATGLPAGVTAAWANNVITISGTPTAVGTFNYTIPLTGGCGNVNATGTITVNPNNTVTGPGSRTLCVNTPLTAITHTTTGATGIGTATGLPAGVTASFANNTITISGTPTAVGTFNYTVPLTGGCGNVNATGTIVVNPCGETLCTYTQGAYGSQGGMACTPAGQKNTYDLIKYALGNWPNNQLYIGRPGRSLTIDSVATPNHDDVQGVINILPGGGKSYALTPGDAHAHNVPDSWLKNDRLNNTLLAQTITLGLNLGITTNLANFQLRNDMLLVTAEPANDCNTRSTDIEACSYKADSLYSTAVIQYLYNNVWDAADNRFEPDGSNNKMATVYELFQLASAALGNALTNPLAPVPSSVTLEAIAGLEDQINNIFDECQVFVGYMTSTQLYNRRVAEGCSIMPTTMAVDPSAAGVESVSDLKVVAYPNPYNNTVSFNFTSPVSGKALLEVYDIVGKRLAIIFEGQVDAGMQKAVNYNVPSAQRVPMIYKLSIGGKTSFGKLLPGSTD